MNNINKREVNKIDTVIRELDEFIMLFDNYNGERPVLMEWRNKLHDAYTELVKRRVIEHNRK